MKLRLNQQGVLQRSTALTLVLMMATFILPSSVLAQNKVLRGSASQSDYYKEAGPSLSREDIKNNDPFSEDSSTQEDVFDAPDGSFDAGSQLPQQPLSGNVQESAPPPFQGTSMPPMQEQAMLPPPQQAQQQMIPQTPRRVIDPNDPDKSEALQLAWDAWHKRVADEIFRRFDAVAQKAFAHSRPLACRVAYTVTKDGSVDNIRVLERSPNILFNSMLLLVLKSMKGNPVLAYPPGSRRMSVEKTGTFSRNYGVQGYRYTTGDRETIQQRGGR